jgi:hypothetical protein
VIENEILTVLATGTRRDKEALRVIKKMLKCHAAKLHFNHGASILNSNRKLSKGYARKWRHRWIEPQPK